jgi:hypothetical protein
MKRNIFYLLIIAGTCLSSCLPKDNSVPAGPIPASGTFTGQFKLYHLNSKTGTPRVDSANLNLSMETATGFKVTGDTTTLHAGSYGSYSLNSLSLQMLFVDQTYPPTGTPAKAHLNGIYAYRYDGTTLELLSYGPLDTLQYFYKFTRTGN